jgi:hypothetical protein
MRDILGSVGLRPYIDPGCPIMLSYFTVALRPRPPDMNRLRPAHRN